MKKIFFTLLAFGSVWSLYAQSSDEITKRALEREVKTSGYYLWGEANASTKDEAVHAAKIALVSEINREIANNRDWQFAETIKANDVEYHVEMIDLMRGNQCRVIAYVSKANLTAVFQHNKTPEVELSDKINRQQPEQWASPITTAIVQPVEEAVFATIPPRPYLLMEEQRPSGGNILEQILYASSLYEIQTILVSNKNLGKAAYGTIDKLIQPESAYLIVYKRTGEIVAILDKGSSNTREDLLSGITYGQEIFNNNQVLWFQLFNN